MVGYKCRRCAGRSYVLCCGRANAEEARQLLLRLKRHDHGLWGAQCVEVFIRIETAADFPGTDRHRKGGQIARDSFRRAQEALFYLLNDR